MVVSDQIEAQQVANRLFVFQIFTRLVNEAERLLSQERHEAALAVLRCVFEECYSIFPTLAAMPSPEGKRVASWHELIRQTVAMPSAEMLYAVIHDVRGFFSVMSQPGFLFPPHLPQENGDPISQLRGKFAFVPTSSAAFIERKAEELRLEDRD